MAITALGIGALMTPIYVILIVKGVRALTGIRHVLSTPPGGNGPRLEK